MRSLIAGLVVLMLFATAADARIIKRSAKMVRSSETELLFSAEVGIFPNKHTSSKAEDVALRWGRTYWPLSEFGKCFAELTTPAETARTYGYWGKAVVSWRGETYTAHCFNGPTVFWSRALKE